MRARFFLAVIILTLAGAGRALPALELYVSPNGNDAWSGTLPTPGKEGQDGPFASLLRARDEVR
jgi:hypothetical protein